MNIADLYNEEDFDTVFSREKLEWLLMNDNYDKRIKSLLDECLIKCNIQAKEVSDIIIAGGTCRIPFIQNTLQAYLKNVIKKNCCLKKSIDMDEHIAYGCSYYGLILNGLWKYEIIDNDKTLFSTCNENTNKVMNKIDKYLSHISSIFTNSNVENKDKQLLFNHFKSEFKSIESTVLIDSNEECNDKIDNDTHTEEVDKKRNDFESVIFEYKHDLDLIIDKNYVENERNYLWEVIEALYTDNNLKIVEKMNEFKTEFNRIWEDKKTSKLPLAIVLCQLSVIAYPKQRLDYENQLKELNNLDKKKDPMSKYINMCNVYYYYMI